ncbi:Pyruvate, water dikinase [Solidesulfovibrio carbinoliphilus subsp. oakridgensis]|uniref:Phosphoenolpyruvate synthase n=1 Tax=Solidesulfovibrio carbinoliphilus subsp. oakridgensis TaxID=694327 RepID=G7QB23_9BACT|nr:PEP/pyruvate-binding domain-containing protein [Solidesulfovibrio carbinoliphilus]EHJ48765.1 Pyruvate, water dikinase [Solidesulfovibrio carbinoliphilus subsp. oakridgensis]
MGVLDRIGGALGWRSRGKTPVPFVVLFKKFKSILERNNRILTLMADMGDKLGGEYVFDRRYIESACEELSDQIFKLVSDLSILNRCRNVPLFIAFEAVRQEIADELAGRHHFPATAPTLPLSALRRDMGEAAGGKFAMLGELKNKLALPVPDGFVITTGAFADFMAKNGLPDFIRDQTELLDADEEGNIRQVSDVVRERILAAALPRSLGRGIHDALADLARRLGAMPPSLAVRSSAWDEDGETSFAGQYESVIGVAAKDVPEAFKRVVAGAYSPEAWLYRRRRGFREHEAVMAVGCQAMVDSTVSGGLYTYAPMTRNDEGIFVSAAWGLCAPVMSGEVETDSYLLARRAPFAATSREIARKSRQMVLVPGRGAEYADVAPEKADAPCLTEAELALLGEASLSLEKYFKRPQDVEWTFDAAGRLYVLQSRPLVFSGEPARRTGAIDAATAKAEVLFSGRGDVVQRGVAMGRVFVVRTDADLDDFPFGAILVAHHTSPRYSRIMARAQGILTDIGSPAGHMAAVAREFRLPTIVGCGVATSLLKTGDEITVDATQNVVYRGLVKELRFFELTEEAVYEDSYEYRLLRRLLKKITPLNLVDPHSPDFTPAACRTYHDITRYIHEQAVAELIDLSESRQGILDASARKLRSPLPLNLSLIDLDNEAGADTSPIGVEDLHCLPLREILTGLTASGMWATDPVPVDMGSFMASLTRTLGAGAPGSEKLGRNLAVVSREYLNLNLHLGYHFVLIDAYVGEVVNDNALYFRFLGGVTDLARRARRARCIGKILEQADFRVELHGDLVVGRLKKFDREAMRGKLRLLGGLVGFTRQLDVRMGRDDDPHCFAEEFLAAIQPVLSGEETPHADAKHL